MPPGRRPQPRPEEEPITEYEQLQVKNIMRNNQMMQRLGISGLASLLRKPSRNARNKSSQPGHDKDKEGPVDKVMQVSDPHSPYSSVATKTVQSGGAISKRVMASMEQDQPAIFTRQRTKDARLTDEVLQGSTTNAHEDALAVVDGPTQPDGQMQICNEGEQNTLEDHCLRGTSMGKDLDRITRGLCSKIPVIVAEGNKRPEAPMQAAKLATEAGIVIRQHIPILSHWKEYKKNDAYFQDFVGKVSAQFAIDTNNTAVVGACYDLLKSRQRQLRYKLKKRYFDGVPANEVPRKSPVKTISNDLWKILLDMWFSEKHKNKCAANKMNREKVKYHHRTGSRRYLAQAHVLKQKDEFRNAPPTAIDFFKDFHCSSKTGFSEPVKEAIARMEAILDEPVEEGQTPKTPAEVVAQVLPSTKFLQNAGLEPPVAKRAKIAYVDATRVQELEAQLEVEKQGSSLLKDKLQVLEESKDKQQQELDKQQQELEVLKKQLEENNAFLQRMFNKG